MKIQPGRYSRSWVLGTCRYAVALLLCGCAAGPSMPPQGFATGVVDPAPADPRSLDPAVVWTIRQETPISDGEGAAYAVQHVFTRLEVVGRDSVGLRVVCTGCPERREGYIADGDYIRQEVDYVPPEIATWGELHEFALAVRTAALEHNLGALRPVMAQDFTFSFVGIQTPETAFDAWRFEDFNTLDQLPGLIDRGLATRDSSIWSAPPAFVEELSYRGLRAGFRRSEAGRWEWLYLIRGIAEP